MPKTHRNRTSTFLHEHPKTPDTARHILPNQELYEMLQNREPLNIGMTEGKKIIKFVRNAAKVTYRKTAQQTIKKINQLRRRPQNPRHEVSTQKGSNTQEKEITKGINTL